MKKITQQEFEELYNNHQEWLINANLPKVSFEEIDFSEIDFSKFSTSFSNRVILSKANLQRADLQKADLQRAEVQRADLSEANLRFANLRFAYLRFANLHGADLRGADLRFAKLHGADLREADLRFVNLCGANLCEANLSGADLGGADLSEADLSEANLSGTDLGNANLIRIKFERTILINADITGARVDDVEKLKRLGAIIIPEKNTEQLLNEKIQQLEKEKIELLSNNKVTADELKEKQRQIDQFNKVLEQNKEKQEEQKERFKKSTLENIDNAFQKFGNANADINKEIWRLNLLFWLFLGGAVISILFLIFLINSYYCKIVVDKMVDPPANLVRYSPLFILCIAFVWGFIAYTLKVQRQIRSLREYTNKTNAIKSILEAYVSIEDESNRDKIRAKITEMFDEFSKKVILTNIDTLASEERIQQSDQKEKPLAEQAMEKIVEITKIGNITKLD